MKKIFIIVIAIFVSIGACSENKTSKDNQTENNFNVVISSGSSNVDYYYLVSDFWREAGKYAGINAFDGNLKTCAARDEQIYSVMGGEDYLFTIKFNKYIRVDTIKIAAGCFFNEKYYKFNNRPKEIKITFGVKNTISKNKNDSTTVRVSETFKLQDKMEYQVLNFKKVYNINWIRFKVSSFYKGSKYDDTCISDIKFYYQGKAIKINNIESYKIKNRQEFIKNLDDFLKLMFNSDTIYTWQNDYKEEAKFIFKTNGELKVSFSGSDKRIDYLKKVKKWKIHHGKFLFLIEKRWVPVKYYFSDPDCLEIFQIGKKNMTDKKGNALPLFDEEAQPAI